MATKAANRCKRLGLAPATTAALLASTALVSAQSALPTGGQVAAGSATISASGPALTVNQGSQRAIVNWQGFSVGQPNSVTFVQPSTSSAILNRVTGSASSTIAGQITGNGQVFLVNPNGIAITSTGTVKVGGGFVASTLGIEDRDFMAGRLIFSGGSAPAAVSNDGTITAGSGGFVGLLGGVVSNGGTINVPLGRVGLGAATQATLDPTGDGFLQVAVPSDATAADGKPLIDVSGKLSARGGLVEIKAATAQGAVRDAINVSGRVSARSVSGRNGSVVLGGGEGGSVQVTGRVSASGRDDAGKVALSGRVVEVAKGGAVTAKSRQGQGGSVSLKGDIVNNSGSIDVSGASGGAIDIAGISIGSYGAWNLQGASGAGGVFTARGSQGYVETTSGLVLASGATAGGSIAIDAPNLFSSGRHDASSAAGRGGKVTLTGERLALVAASIDASGATGGGAVRIGGDYQGGGTLAHAQSTTISPATTIRADATQAGNGGSVVVWSDAQTDFYGTISARGGEAGGNGGLVEVSSKGDLVFGGSAAVNAPLGASGTVLLDPKNIVIDDTTGKYPQYRLIDPLQGAGNNQFGGNVAQLQGVAKTVVTAHGSAIGGQSNAGAVYLYDTVTGALISTLTGSAVNDLVGNGGVTTLSNGNYVVRSINWTSNRGAVTWGSGATGVSGAVSSSNSLVGSAANDSVGVNGITMLSNGNYLVASGNWSGTLGALTWASGATGIAGTVSSSNSLVGSVAGDAVGSYDITALGNGHYVVRTDNWSGGKGAVTWGSGTAGVSGAISSSNSLVGSVAGDYVGNYGITVLSNGNYVVNSTNWTSNRGAVTLGNGAIGTTGVVSASNSLVGTITGSSGDRIGIGGITALSNGNYVVGSYNWDGNKGAVTWRSGTDTTGAVVSSSNSLVGSVTNDQVGTGPNGITALTNGHYVVRSSNWNGTVGAVTWGNGTTGATVGAVTASNSLVGSAAGDNVGIQPIIALTNGNYVVRTPTWDGNKGAVTWGNGATGATVGAVSASNSLVGATAGTPSSGDNVGNGGVTALSNGNYVVASSLWSGGRGAATWGNGATGATVGTISSSNSLVGTNTTDRVGSAGAVALSNGHYVVRSAFWGNGVLTSLGAVTWGNGATGATVGAVSASNSLVGMTTNDRVGAVGVTALSNGNYIVRSSNWSGGRGAVTWGNGATGATVGAVSSSNSLVGKITTDRVGLGAANVTELGSGNYVVTTTNWSTAKGAVTWGSGTAGVSGEISSSNSLIASTNGSALAFRTAGDTSDVFIASSANDSTSGRVFVGLGDLNALTFGRAMAQDVTIHSDAIARQLNAGSALTLQASNDITVNSAITANNPAGNGGHLTLQAGRSILVNAAITTDNGNLTLIGNDRLANGVVDAQRDAGAAVITLGAAVNAGTGTVDVQLRDGAGKTNTAAGAITLGTVTAGKVSAVNSSASGGLTLNGTVTASGIGDAVVLASNGAFTNNAGAGALSLTGGGRWLVYSSDPAAASFGNLDSSNRAIWNASYATLAPGSVTQTGNRYLFAYQPTLTFTSTGLTKAYGDDATGDLATAYTVSGLNAGLANAYLGDTLGSVVSGSASLTSTGASATVDVAGSPHAISITQGSLSAMTGYAFAFDSAGLLTVTPRAVTVTASSGQGKTYGNVDPTLGYAVTAGTLVGGDSFTGAMSRAAGENVGNYAIGRGSLSLGANYTLSYAGSDFGITPRAVTVSASSGQGKAYGDADPTLTYTVTAGSLAFADSFSGSLSRAVGENVGNYAIGQGTLALNANYALSYAGSDFGITPRAVTVSATGGQGKTYGNVDPTLGYAVTAGNLVGGDSFTGALSRAVGENVGNYAIGQGSLSLGSNYTLSYVGSDFGITPRAVTVSATGGQGKTYGDVDPTLTYTVTAGSLAFADGFSGALSRVAGENVGNYAIVQGSLSLGTNYTLSYAGSSFGITPRAVTVSATGGQGKTYGDVDPTLTYVITAGSLAFADGFSGALSRAAGENVGNYAIGQGSLSLGSNYTMTYAGSNFGITPRAVTVSATGGQGKTYGDADPTLTYSVTAGSLAFADSFSGSLSRAAGENVGNYAIGQGSLSLGSNYTLSYAGSNFGITPRAVTVSATAGQGKTYGDVDPTLTYAVTAGNLVGGDSFTGALSRAVGENVGNYAIGQGTLTLGSNYALSYAGSAFGITPRAVTVSAAGGQGKIYGDIDAALTYSLTAGSLVGADAFTGALSRAAGENVGNYAIGQGTLTLGSNYSLSYAGSNFGITPRAVTVSATAGQGKIHGDVDPVLAYSLTAGSLVAGDAFTGALGRAAGEDVGKYAIGRGSLALSSNYTLSYVGSIFGITPRPAAESPELPPPVLPSSTTNIWSMIARQPAWLGDQAGEAPGAGTGYVETSAPEGFRVCHPAKITMELSNSGRVQLSGSDTACAQ